MRLNASDVWTTERKLRLLELLVTHLNEATLWWLIWKVENFSPLALRRLRQRINPQAVPREQAAALIHELERSSDGLSRIIKILGDEFSRNAHFQALQADILRAEQGGDVTRSGNTLLSSKRLSLYPRVESADGWRVVAGQTVEFAIRLDTKTVAGVNASLAANFPADAQTIELHAEASSSDFVPPDGVTWAHTFTVNRSGQASPSPWLLQARVRDVSQRTYCMEVTFHASGAAMGAITITAVADSTEPRLPAVSSLDLRLPQDRGAAATLSLRTVGPAQLEILLYRDGVLCSEAIPWAIDYSSIGQTLQSAANLDALIDIGFGLNVDLPAAMRAFLEDPAFTRKPLLLLSDARVAPFELIQLRPAENGPFLGVDRPVCRWTRDLPMPDVEVGMGVKEVACIRPNYQGNAALADAAKEEEFLASIFPNLLHVGTRDEIGLLLGTRHVQLVHFAGHAMGVPPGLVLQDGIVPATRFHPKSPLLKERPLFFVNGCDAGKGAILTPAATGDFARIMLTAGCRGFVAPTIRVESAASSEAAKLFYCAIGNGSSVVEAVQQIRARAFVSDTPDIWRASFASYLSFAPTRSHVEVI